MQRPQILKKGFARKKEELKTKLEINACVTRHLF